MVFPSIENPASDQHESTNTGSESAYIIDSADLPMYVAWHIAPSLETIFTLSHLAVLRHDESFFERTGMTSFLASALTGTLPVHALLL